MKNWREARNPGWTTGQRKKWTIIYGQMPSSEMRRTCIFSPYRRILINFSLIKELQISKWVTVSRATDPFCFNSVSLRSSKWYLIAMKRTPNLSQLSCLGRRKVHFSHTCAYFLLGGKFNPRAALITRNKDMLRSLYTIELLKCNEIPSWVVKFARSPIAKSYSWTWLPRFRFEASLRLAWGDWLILLLNQYASKPASIVVFS